MDTELAKPEFWVTHYYLLLGDEERDSSDLVQPIFGIEAGKLYKYYERLVQPAAKARVLSVSLDGGYGVGVEYVDCGEDGNAVRFYISHASWARPELVGHDSPHFALPAFRWEEVKKVHASVKDKSEAAAAGLLLFPATYITPDDSQDDVAARLSRWWEDLPYVAPLDIGLVVRNAAAYRTAPDVKWRSDPKLGWINDGPYSFRNPETLMCKFSETRFERVRQFLSSMEYPL